MSHLRETITSAVDLGYTVRFHPSDDPKCWFIEVLSKDGKRLHGKLIDKMCDSPNTALLELLNELAVGAK